MHCDARKSFIDYKATAKYFIKKNTAKKDTNAKLQKDPALEPYFCFLFMFQKCFSLPWSQKYH